MAENRRASLSLLFVAVLLLPSVASAWVETTVRGHQARVTVGADGRGEIRHELVIKLRGGPLPALQLEGFGEASPLPDASVSRVEQGAIGLLAPLRPTPSEGGGLRLDVAMERGLRGGNYLFQFGHTLSFREVGWLESRGEDVLVTFVGPRLPTGVDAARVTFVVPHGSYPPRLLEQTTGPSAGVLLHQLRRGATEDEIDLVRAHLAVGEPATWQILVARDAFGAATAALPPPPAGPVPVVERALRKSGTSWPQLAAALLVGVAFAALSGLKGRAVARAARLREARERPLLPGPIGVRALVVGVAAASACFATWLHRPGWASAAALVVCLGSTYLLPSRRVVPRGPGSWKKLELDESALVERLPGRLLDAGTALGCAVFCAAWLGAALLAYRALSTSTYVALLVALLALGLVPSFWTGRAADLPQRPLEQGRHWLRYLARRLDERHVRLELWGRVPTAPGLEWTERSGELPPDEVRVRLVPARVESGLRAFEVVLEEGPGSFVVPCVLVRVLEDSEAARRLARLPWQRGRTPEEKVALLRPSLPVPRALVALLRQLCAQLAKRRRPIERSESSPGESPPGLPGQPLVMG